ncbi:odorant receptor 94b-like isoform X4 [Leptopilina heterotoma]|uniref:odorant receptor 94b-like isoform X4 n=1 Tax=Leptopilina heterotoma TaxID=63436 RepID=UPI001CA9047D|nr:odorant receptor 94b-like isoform X4 [Leptopilina heterotoma]
MPNIYFFQKKLIFYVEMEAYNSHFKIIKYFASILGLWPSQSKFMKYSMTTFAWLLLMSLLIAQLLAIRNVYESLDLLIIWMPPFIVNIFVICYLTTACVKRNKLELIFSKMKENYLHYESELEFEILEEYGLLTKNINKVAVTIWIHQMLMTTLLTTVILTIDGIFEVFIFHACGQFEILGLKIKNMVKFDYNQSNSFEKNVKKEIRFFVQKHQSVIMFVLKSNNVKCKFFKIIIFSIIFLRLVNDISDVFSFIYFIGLGFNMIVISFTGVQIIMNLGNTTETTKILSYNFILIFRLFCLTLPCQCLIDQSTLLFENIYECYWYNLSPQSNKLLGILMLMCMKPVTFTAGKLYTFSMNSFSNVVRTSVSYFMVLLSLRE